MQGLKLAASAAKPMTMTDADQVQGLRLVEGLCYNLIDDGMA
jgi:hypothetical protein